VSIIEKNDCIERKVVRIRICSNDTLQAVEVSPPGGEGSEDSVSQVTDTSMGARYEQGHGHFHGSQV
jgi:hypothetical protein